MIDEKGLEVSSDTLETESSVDERIHQLGYRTELRREFGLFSAFSFAISVSGLFGTVATTFTYPLIAGGASCVVWMWLISGVGCMCIALSVAEIVSAYPTSGGLYFACTQVVPHRWASACAWTDGWLNILGQFAGLSSTIYGAAELLLQIASMGSDFSYVPTTKQIVGVQAALLIFVGVVNTLPTKWLERITKWYVVLHFACLLSGAIALLAKTSPKHNADYVFGHVASSSGWTPKGFSFIFGALECSWVMTDYAATSQISDELIKPELTAPWAISLAMLATWVLGFLYNIVLVFCMGDPMSIMNETQPVAMIYYNSLGKGAAIFFSVAMLLINLFVAIPGAHANARTLWVQARDGMYPYVGHWLAKVDKHTKTPIIAVWANIIICIAINLIALASDTAIDAIFNVCSAALDWSYVVPIIAKLIFNRYQPGPWNLGKFSVPVNLWASLWTTFISIIFFMPTELPVTVKDMNYAVVFFVGVIVLAISLWFLGGKKVYRGPEAAAPKPETLMVMSPSDKLVDTTTGPDKEAQ